MIDLLGKRALILILCFAAAALICSAAERPAAEAEPLENKPLENKNETSEAKPEAAETAAQHSAAAVPKAGEAIYGSGVFFWPYHRCRTAMARNFS